jgi:hypothetical protein
MYKVIFHNDTETTIDDSKGDKIILFKKQGMLNARQQEWLKTVKEITKLRDTPDHWTLLQTKDMICSCNECDRRRNARSKTT